MTRHLEVRRGAYYDSVTLMSVSRAVATRPGVTSALVAMATELNLGLLADMGFDVGALEGVGPNDLVVAIDAPEEALPGALAGVEEALVASARGGGGQGLGEVAAPRTIGRAARDTERDLALISVPGQYAFADAMDALRAGLHVMVFSDNVPLVQEVTLKDEGARRDLLVMGPDAGTAIVGGLGLGFANVVRPGPVSLVAASGTGAQQVCALLDDAEVGVRHVLGVGGRDLSAEVSGRATLAALEALDADAGTELIVLVSKPPAPDVAARVRAAAERCATPVVLGFVGRGERDLTAAVDEAVRKLGAGPLAPATWPAPVQRLIRPGRLRGLYSGGTLCDEAMVIASEALGPIASNIPLEPDWALSSDLRADGHVAIDFGDDQLTRGRPHPMLDATLRVERIADEAKLDGDNVLLLDVVLGHGAHPDPAADLAPALEEAVTVAAADGRRLAVVVALIATRDDPQGRDRQAERLVAAGASVHLSNAAAAREALRLLGKGSS